MERINNILNQWCNDCELRNAENLYPQSYVTLPGDLS